MQKNAQKPASPQARQAQRPAMQAAPRPQQWQQPQHPARPQQKPQQDFATKQHGRMFALPKAAPQLVSDDADPTVRRSAFSRPSIANDVSDDEATQMHDRSGERVLPQQENVIPLKARRAAGGRR